VDEATYKELFGHADADGDGKVRPLEMHTLVGLLMQRGNWTPPGFKKSDENGDGQVAGKELRDAAAWWLKQRFGVNDAEYQGLLRVSDADSDDHLSPSEFKTLLGNLEMAGARHHDGGPDHHRGPAPLGGPPRGAEEDQLRRHFGVDEATYKELFGHADADGDGKVRPLEMHTLVGLLMQRGNWTPPGFKKSDENGDGQVAGKELRDAAAWWLKQRFGVNDAEYQGLLRVSDADSDDHLSPSEFKTLLGNLEMAGARHHDGGPDHHRGPAPLGGPLGFKTLLGSLEMGGARHHDGGPDHHHGPAGLEPSPPAEAKVARTGPGPEGPRDALLD